MNDGREVNPTRLKAALEGAGTAQQLRNTRLKSGNAETDSWDLVNCQ